MKREIFNVQTGESIITDIPQEEIEQYKKEDDKKIAIKQIFNLKNQITKSDYKIIKAYEYSLVGLEPPYDLKTLHIERQAMRDEINELETQLSALQGE